MMVIQTLLRRAVPTARLPARGCHQPNRTVASTASTYAPAIATATRQPPALKDEAHDASRTWPPKPPLTPTSTATAPSATSLIELAATITKNAENLERYLKANDLPTPSFEPNAMKDFPRLPEHMQCVRAEVVRATRELSDLVVGPTEMLRWMSWDVSSLSARLILGRAEAVEWCGCSDTIWTGNAHSDARKHGQHFRSSLPHSPPFLQC